MICRKSRYRNIFSIDDRKQIREGNHAHQSDPRSEPEPIGDDKLIYVRDRDDNGAYGFNLCTIDHEDRRGKTVDRFHGRRNVAALRREARPRCSSLDSEKGEKHIYQAYVDVSKRAMLAALTSLATPPFLTWSQRHSPTERIACVERQLPPRRYPSQRTTDAAPSIDAGDGAPRTRLPRAPSLC